MNTDWRIKPCRPTPPGRRSCGFTLFELLIATAVIGLILASVIPFILSKQESARRIQCAQNLALIRNAMNVYVTDHHSYPRVRYDASGMAEGWTAYSGVDAADPFAATSAVKPNDVTASLWLLVRDEYILDTATFVCPSSGDWPDRLYDATGNKVSAKKRGNFRSGNHLSYSVFCPFGSAVKDGWTDTLKPGCAVMADMNPGVNAGDDVTRPAAYAAPEAYAIANSHNHGRAGQNVLYADTSVRFELNPYVGVGYQRVEEQKDGSWSALIAGDNIYTALKSTPIPPGQTPPNEANGFVGRSVSPAWAYDSYLVPTAAD